MPWTLELSPGNLQRYLPSRSDSFVIFTRHYVNYRARPLNLTTHSRRWTARSRRCTAPVVTGRPGLTARTLPWLFYGQRLILFFERSARTVVDGCFFAYAAATNLHVFELRLLPGIDTSFHACAKSKRCANAKLLDSGGVVGDGCLRKATLPPKRCNSGL